MLAAQGSRVVGLQGDIGQRKILPGIYHSAVVEGLASRDKAIPRLTVAYNNRESL